MPNLNEFLSNKNDKDTNSKFEKLLGVKPCSKCDIDVDEILWDSENLIMKWTCSSGHETVHIINM